MPSSPQNNRLLALTGLTLAVALGFLILLVSGGARGAGPIAQFSPVPPPPPTSAGVPVVQVGGRDPFQPLVGAAATPTASPGPFFSPSPGVSPAPTVSPAPSPPPAPDDGSSSTLGGHTVILLSVFRADGEDRAQVEVDGTVYTVSEGQEFDGNFRLVSLDGSCGDFLFGDEEFTLCANENK